MFQTAAMIHYIKTHNRYYAAVYYWAKRSFTGCFIDRSDIYALSDWSDYFRRCRIWK